MRGQSRVKKKVDGVFRDSAANPAHEAAGDGVSSGFQFLYAERGGDEVEHARA